jgi:hypothetical protein
MTFDELVASLRQVDGQRDKGKRPPDFHFRSRPFLHFHNGPDQTYADVRFGGDFPSDDARSCMRCVRCCVRSILICRASGLCR